jgi:hypothetical protein
MRSGSSVTKERGAYPTSRRSPLPESKYHMMMKTMMNEKMLQK